MVVQINLANFYKVAKLNYTILSFVILRLIQLFFLLQSISGRSDLQPTANT